MKNFLKNNWFKITIILLIIIATCFYYFSYFLPQERQTRLLGLQEQCSTQAQNFFTTNGYTPSDGTTFNYTDHFNSKLNKCFILVNSYDNNGTELIDLYSVLEGKHYAEYNGHAVCNSVALTLTGQPDECKTDSGSIWYGGNDTNTPDVHVGYGGINGGSGNEDTQKQFMSYVEPFMSN
jgi:hypothetical protein